MENTGFNCCEHCEHAYDDVLPDNHKVECSAGCNDDPTPCCPDPGCPGRYGKACEFPGYCDNH